LGLIHEVERLLSAGLSPALPSMQGLGYRQILPFLKGERTMAEAISLLKRDSRRYAKRQMTWFNQDANMRWIDLGPGASTEKALDQVWPMLTVLMRFL
jgi:tRNA dimethylallyltransferase